MRHHHNQQFIGHQEGQKGVKSDHDRKDSDATTVSEHHNSSSSADNYTRRNINHFKSSSLRQSTSCQGARKNHPRSIQDSSTASTRPSATTEAPQTPFFTLKLIYQIQIPANLFPAHSSPSSL
ncbi:hypothetical protein CRE_10437 [Caenorhabditis remanei]|uniref:Uncharacterized protein n=1 Tax=Caenorhabditis remanei TaxID=31234 RepID=E3N0V9_CAERE|nr:hypothetical protein CRE_10437 [Caenorhabditis remanei]